MNFDRLPIDRFNKTPLQRNQNTFNRHINNMRGTHFLDIALCNTSHPCHYLHEISPTNTRQIVNIPQRLNYQYHPTLCTPYHLNKHIHTVLTQRALDQAGEISTRKASLLPPQKKKKKKNIQTYSMAPNANPAMEHPTDFKKMSLLSHIWITTPPFHQLWSDSLSVALFLCGVGAQGWH